MTRVTHRMLVLPAVLVASAVLFLVEERVRGSVALRNWERVMRARGERLTVQELTPSPPTNPAVRIVSSFEAQTRLSGAVAPAAMPIGMQAVASGKAHLVSAAAQWLDREGRTNRWIERGEGLAALRVQLSELRPTLTNRTLFIHLNLAEGYELLMPHLATLKAAMLALNAGALHALHERRMDEAYENLLAATFLLDLPRDEPFLISQLVSMACAAISQAGVWEALQTEGWTDGQLAALQARWGEQQFVAGLGWALEGERAVAALTYDPKRYSIRRLMDVAGDMFGVGVPGSASDGAPRSEVAEFLGPLLEWGRQGRRFIHLNLWRVAWAQQDQLFHHREMQTMINAARRAAQDRQWAPPVKDETGAERSSSENRAGRTSPSGYDRLRYWLALAALPGFDAYAAKAVRSEVVREQIVAAIALKRFQLRHGRLPPTLESLVPEFLTEVPRDWFIGAPMRYRPADNGSFVLYSVGEDGVDDGGDSRNAQGEVRAFQAGRDLVWPRRATVEEVAAAEQEWVKPGRPRGTGR